MFSKSYSKSSKAVSGARHSIKKPRNGNRAQSGKRNAFFGFEPLEQRQLMSFTPVAAAPYTTPYNPPITAPPQEPDASSPAITGFAAKAVSKTQINLTWSSGEQPVDVCEDINGQWKEIAQTNTESYTVTGLQPGTNYEFMLGTDAVFTQDGDLDYTNVESATTQNQEVVVAPPTIYSATATSPSKVTLAWTAATNATQYVVQQQVGGNWVTDGTVAGTSCTVSGLNAASTNLFRVVGKNAAGTTGQPSNTVSVLTWPAAPSNFLVKSVSSTQVNLSWSAVAGITNYVVNYRIGQGAWTALKTLAPGQTSLAVTLSAGVNYSFEVGAANASGTTYANPMSVTTTATQAAKPAVPSGFTYKAVSASEVQLSWNAVAGATSYVLDYYNGSSWQQLTTTSATSIDVIVTAGNTYYFDVAATNAAGTSSFAPYVGFKWQ